MRANKIKIGLISISILLAITGIIYAGKPLPPPAREIFPGQADPRVSNDLLEAYDHAMNRRYGAAITVLKNVLGEEMPDNPAGPTGEMLVYLLMMLENDDSQYDEQFRDAASRATQAAKVFAKNNPQNDWYNTLLGASYGIHGIYFLRNGEYITGLNPAMKGYNYMQDAKKMNENNWEARLAIGLFLYYRSAYSGVLPGMWEDSAKKGIDEVTLAGQNRPYLHEASNIALYYIHINKKEYDEALEHVDELIFQRPKFVIFYTLAGRAAMEKGDSAKAKEYYMQASELDPSLYLPYIKLARISYDMGDKKEAKKWLEKFNETLNYPNSVHKAEAGQLKRKLK